MATPNNAASSAPGGGGALETPQPPPPTSSSPEPSKFKDPFLHNVALGITPIAVGALFLPPRRLDSRMLVLGASALWGMNQLSYDYRGQSIAQKYGLTRPDSGTQQGQGQQQQTKEALKYGGMNDMPTERSAQVQRLLREEKARRLELAGLSDAERAARLRELQDKEKQRRGPLESLWMGDADADWKEKRDQKEKEALQDGGGGYWGLITDQLSEVWSRGERKAQEEKEKKEAQQQQLKRDGDNAKD